MYTIDIPEVRNWRRRRPRVQYRRLVGFRGFLRLRNIELMEFEVIFADIIPEKYISATKRFN